MARHYAIDNDVLWTLMARHYAIDKDVLWTLMARNYAVGYECVLDSNGKTLCNRQ
jgi:hypothetical protein